MKINEKAYVINELFDDSEKIPSNLSLQKHMSDHIAHYELFKKKRILKGCFHFRHFHVF